MFEGVIHVRSHSSNVEQLPESVHFCGKIVIFLYLTQAIVSAVFLIWLLVAVTYTTDCDYWSPTELRVAAWGIAGTSICQLCCSYSKRDKEKKEHLIMKVIGFAMSLVFAAFSLMFVSVAYRDLDSIYTCSRSLYAPALGFAIILTIAIGIGTLFICCGFCLACCVVVGKNATNEADDQSTNNILIQQTIFMPSIYGRMNSFNNRTAVVSPNELPDQMNFTLDTEKRKETDNDLLSTFQAFERDIAEADTGKKNDI